MIIWFYEAISLTYIGLLLKDSALPSFQGPSITEVKNSAAHKGHCPFSRRVAKTYFSAPRMAQGPHHECSTTLILPLLTGGGNEEKHTGCNKKSFHPFPAASVIYLYSTFLSPGLDMPWEGISGIGFHWDSTCTHCSTFLLGRL